MVDEIVEDLPVQSQEAPEDDLMQGYKLIGDKLGIDINHSLATGLSVMLAIVQHPTIADLILDLVNYSRLEQELSRDGIDEQEKIQLQEEFNNLINKFTELDMEELTDKNNGMEEEVKEEIKEDMPKGTNGREILHSIIEVLMPESKGKMVEFEEKMQGKIKDPVSYAESLKEYLGGSDTEKDKTTYKRIIESQPMAQPMAKKEFPKNDYERKLKIMEEMNK